MFLLASHSARPDWIQDCDSSILQQPGSADEPCSALYDLQACYQAKCNAECSLIPNCGTCSPKPSGTTITCTTGGFTTTMPAFLMSCDPGICPVPTPEPDPGPYPGPYPGPDPIDEPPPPMPWPSPAPVPPPSGDCCANQGKPPPFHIWSCKPNPISGEKTCKAVLP